jgi:methyl-accepting chemotaxis protein-1 (serine sensor receptor)
MFENLTVRFRLLLLVSCYSLLLIGGSFLGIGGLSVIDGGLERVYRDRTIPLQQLAAIEEMLLKNRLAVVSAAAEPTPEMIDASAVLVDRNLEASGKLWEAYTAGTLSADERKLAEKFAEDRKRFVEEGLRPALAQLREGRVGGAELHIRSSVRPLFEPVEAGIKALIQRQIDGGQEEFKRAHELYVFIRGLAIAGVTVSIVLGFIVGVLLVRSIVNAVQTSVGVATRIAAGHLDNRIDIDRSDELGDLLRALQAMNEGLRGIVREVRDGSASVANASSEIARGNMDLSSRTEQQASTLEQTASSMEELTTTVKQNADNARQANQFAAGASDVVRQGGQAMAGVVGTMQGISEASKKIADIIGVIDSIAFQTNILALNAAVEAARAGEQGRGFAVVAAEVRSLAQRSATAAKEIKALIDESVRKVTDGEQMVETAGETVAQAVSAVKRVSDVIAEIAAASEEQLAGIEQVSRAVTQMDKVVQQNAALVEESASAAEHMNGQAAGLVKAVERFKLGDSEREPPRVGAPARQEPALREPVEAPRAEHGAPARAAKAIADRRPASASSAAAPRTAPRDAPRPERRAALAKDAPDGDWQEF